MSAGVGPPCDVSIPRNQPEPTPSVAAAEPPMRYRGFFTTHRLNSLAVAFILSSSGMIGAQDFAFVVFSTLYLFFISKVSFPVTSPKPSPRIYDEESTIVRAYIVAGAIIGLILPTAYVLTGMLEGNKEGIKAAAPPVFLMACQVLLEGLSNSARFSQPVRVFVPIVYNSWRIPSIFAWASSEFAKTEISRGWVIAGRALAVVNLGLWSFDLLGFLLPFSLPNAFKMYYSNSNEHKED